MNAEDGKAVWQLLNGELKDQFLGWISGERRIRVGFRAGRVEDLAGDDASATARRAQGFLLAGVVAQVARYVSHRDGSDVGQTDSRAIDVEHSSHMR